MLMQLQLHIFWTVQPFLKWEPWHWGSLPRWRMSGGSWGRGRGGEGSWSGGRQEGQQRHTPGGWEGRWSCSCPWWPGESEWRRRRGRGACCEWLWYRQDCPHSTVWRWRPGCRTPPDTRSPPRLSPEENKENKKDLIWDCRNCVPFRLGQFGNYY